MNIIQKDIINNFYYNENICNLNISVGDILEIKVFYSSMNYLCDYTGICISITGVVPLNRFTIFNKKNYYLSFFLHEEFIKKIKVIKSKKKYCKSKLLYLVKKFFK